MMIRFLKELRMRTSLFILSFFIIFQAQADNIYVAPVQGTNVSEKQTKTLRELVKVEVQNNQGHHLANSLEDADYFLQTKVIKFDNFTLSLTRWKGNDKVSTGQWKAQDLSELEKKVSVAVNEILNNSGSQQGAVLYKDKQSLGEKVAEKKQTASMERVEARRQVIVGFGPAYFSRMNSPSSAIGFQAGYVWNVDDHFDLGLQSDFDISTKDSDAYILSGKIITNYLFTTNDISPFIGAGFGYGWASIHNPASQPIGDDSAGGFAFSLQAGVKFFRTSNVNFMLSGEYSQILNKSAMGQPGVFLIKVALLY